MRYLVLLFDCEANVGGTKLQKLGNVLLLDSSDEKHPLD